MSITQRGHDVAMQDSQPKRDIRPQKEVPMPCYKAPGGGLDSARSCPDRWIGGEGVKGYARTTLQPTHSLQAKRPQWPAAIAIPTG